MMHWRHSVVNYILLLFAIRITLWIKTHFYVKVIEYIPSTNESEKWYSTFGTLSYYGSAWLYGTLSCVGSARLYMAFQQGYMAVQQGYMVVQQGYMEGQQGYMAVQQGYMLDKLSTNEKPRSIVPESSRPIG